MTNQEKTNQISAIDLRLTSLEQQLTTAHIEEKKLAEKRDRLNDDFKMVRHEIQILREERDKLNEKVQVLKTLRDESRSKANAVVEELNGISEKINGLKTKTPKRKHDDLQQEVDKIEWKIQTTSLDIAEEKHLIDEVKQLEIQLQAYKRIEKQKKKAADLKKDLAALRTQGDSFHQELNNTAEKSQETHARMIEKITESKKIREEAGTIHTTYLQSKERTKPIRDEYQQLCERRKCLLEKLKTEHDNQLKEKQKELKERLVSEARSKLRQGKELSWDEFQLLNERNTETEN